MGRPAGRKNSNKTLVELNRAVEILTQRLTDLEYELFLRGKEEKEKQEDEPEKKELVVRISF